MADKMRAFWLALFTGLLVLLTAGVTATPGSPAIYGQPGPGGTLPAGTRVYLPMLAAEGGTATPTPLPTGTPTGTPTATALPTPHAEWSQHAGDAQRTSYTAHPVPTPWRWKWAWNGPDANGGLSPGKFRLPRNSQPVTGGGRVYIAAGSRGVYALDNGDGAVLWQATPGGDINSTPAYDHETGALFVVSANGSLYRLNAADGSLLGHFPGEGSSVLPLPPALAGEHIFFSMGPSVYAIDKRTMQQIWRYDAGSPVDTPPAYSASRDSVIVASRDLYVHAIGNGDGARIWRSKTTPRTPGDPGLSGQNAEVSRGWPVIAEQNGLVLIKLRLDWQTLWRWNPWPGSNEAMSSNLLSDPDQQALLALRLDDGSTAFVTNVGHGGFGDGDYMPMGPQPVVKRLADGGEVAYVVMRGSPCLADPCDGRWDSHLGEMMLNSQTVTGFDAGHVRFIRNTFFPTDEQANLSMAGDHLLGGHWMFGLAHQILDRSPSRGGSAHDPITTANLPHIVTSASNCGFSASHYCPDSLTQDGDPRTIPGGFYIYTNQGTVYDRYWSEYASWVVSNDTVYFVSTDGAVVALAHGQPNEPSRAQAAGGAPTSALPFAETLSWVREAITIEHGAAREYAGRTVTVTGELRQVFNNGKAVYLTFAQPHQGSFLVKIAQADWPHFGQPPESLYAAGQRVQVTGLIEWYQGDPVIYARQPGQIEVSGLTAAELAASLFLPLIQGQGPVSTLSPPQRRVNAPFFPGDVAFEQMGIFWFGHLSAASNYADVRVGYNESGVTVYVAVFDRHLWYDESPTPETLTDWDAVTLLIDTDPDPAALSGGSYRFVAQLANQGEARYRAAYGGGGGGWQDAPIRFATLPGWRGESLNHNRLPDRGWAMTFTIPFASLGLAEAPAPGSEWRLGLQLHDRDGLDEAPQPVQVWPEGLQPDLPTTWGRLGFGLPGYVPPPAIQSGAIQIRRPTQDHPSVPDANVGGVTANQCPGDDLHIWHEWADRNYGNAPDFNIQNQSDIADWPCFARYYVTFPLDDVPAGQVILSATLTLHQFGNAGDPNQARPSWIQVLRAAEAWQEERITWNNAPLAWENITGGWVDPIRVPLQWPGVPWTWDVSYAVAAAYARDEPVHLILYSADSAYHSGKYFVSSDTGDWNSSGRPTLSVVWGRPVHRAAGPAGSGERRLSYPLQPDLQPPGRP